VRRLLAAAAAVAAGCASLPETAMSPDAPASLAAAETAFASQSVREGMRAAFLAWLAPDATLFRNGPVNGPAVIAAEPDPPIVLDWRPAYVEVAASGELGLSTGPWKMTRRGDPSAAPRHGQFVSVWKRDAAGAWRVRVDLGISHAGAALWDAPLVARVPSPPGAGSGSTIASAEARFASLAAEGGDAAAYAALASPAIRLYREGHAPFLGREAALASPAASPAKTAWTLETHEAGASADLGYATGRYGPGGGATAGHYVRIWRHEPGGWRIALDVVNAVAPP
jgi:ketosteroid isomerase-like protein